MGVRAGVAAAQAEALRGWAAGWADDDPGGDSGGVADALRRAAILIERAAGVAVPPGQYGDERAMAEPAKTIRDARPG